MARATAAMPAAPPIVERIEESRRRERRRARLIFGAVWALVLGFIALLFAMTGNIDTGWIATWAPYIVGGAGITVVVCVASIGLATVLALIGALGRLSSNPVAYALASLYTSFVRGTPLLVQIYVIYLSLPSIHQGAPAELKWLTGPLLVLPALAAGILALGINYGAYMTEIFRAGIQAVPPGQREAALSLAMSERQLRRRIVLPQATRIVIPAIGNEFVAMIKDSALVSIISVQEVLWRANTSGKPSLNTLEAFLVAALVYWVLTIIFSFFQERLERRMARSDR